MKPKKFRKVVNDEKSDIIAGVILIIFGVVGTAIITNNYQDIFVKFATINSFLIVFMGIFFSIRYFVERKISFEEIKE